MATNTPTLTDFTMSENIDMASAYDGAYYEHNTSLYFIDGDVLTYSATLDNGLVLPSWISIAAFTGVLSGTPNNENIDSINIMVTATDSYGTSISDAYTLTINSVDDALIANDATTLTVDVVEVNNPPIASDDKLTIDEYAVVVIKVLDNDIDADGDNLTLASAFATDGDVVINADGTLTYTATPRFNGIDYITYVVSDGNGGTDTATVKLLVTTDASEEEDDSLEVELEILEGGLDIESGDTENWHEVNLVAGEQYVFSLEADNVGIDKLEDAYIELRDESGDIVNKYDGLSDTVIGLEAPTTGKYYLVVQSRDDLDAGDYKIIVRDSDDHGAIREESTIISFIANEVSTDTVTVLGGIQWEDRELDSVPQELKGVIPDHDEDWFSFELSVDDAKQYITFDLEVANTGKQLKDATVEIFDPDNNLVARASGKDLDDGSASIALQILSTGNYTVRVTDAQGSTGDYQLTATKTFSPDDEDEDRDVEFDFEKSAVVGDTIIDVDAHVTGSLVFSDVTRSISVSTIETRDKGTFSVDKDIEEYEFIPNEVLKNSIILGDKTIEVSIVDALDLYIPSSSYKYTPVDKISSEYFEVDLDDGSIETVRVEIKDVEDVSHAIEHEEVIKVGNIGFAGDIDTHKVPIIKENSYFIEVVSVADGQTAPLKKAELILKWSNGTQSPVEVTLSNSYSNVVSSMPSAIFEAEDDGFVYIEVKATKSSDVGQYAIRIIDLGEDGGDDAIDQIPNYDLSMTSMFVGDSKYGSLENADDVDIIAVNLVAGQTTTIEVISQGSLATTHIILLNGAGEVIYSEKSDRDLVAKINAQVADTGVYFIEINNAHVEDNKGDYLINIIDQTSNADWSVSSSDGLGTATDQWYAGVNALNISALGGEFTGDGVKVGVVDSGIYYTHSAFSDISFTTNSGLNSWAIHQNLTNSGAYTADNGTFDVYSISVNGSDLVSPVNHGTLVSGIIAGDSSTDNFIGLSPGAEIHSWHRGNVETIAYVLNSNNFSLNPEVAPVSVDVSNNSWNYNSTPFNDNFLDSGTDAADIGAAIQSSVEEGVVFVFSAGNFRTSNDNVNYHNLTNSPLTITVASVDHDNIVASTSNPGSAILVASYGENIYSTDIATYYANDYNAYSGTSFAAPEVSAIIALMLEANPNLGYRDIHAILAHSAIKSNHIDDPVDYWNVNQGDSHNLGGLHFNDDMGFGIVNPYSAVRLAETWRNNVDNITITSGESNKDNVTSGLHEYTDIISNTGLLVKTMAVGDIEVEHVVLKVDLQHDYLSDVTIEIKSPNGTISTLMDAPSVSTPTGLVFEFSSVQFYGENSGGDWVVTITDSVDAANGVLNSLELIVYGSINDSNDQYIFTNEFIDQDPLDPIVVDTLGVDWINASTVTSDVIVDLTSVSMSFAAVAPDISGLTGVSNIVTGDGNDTLTGNDAVNNILDGGRGTDTVIYADLLDLEANNYSFVFNADHVLVTETASGIVDTLYSIENLNFGGESYLISATGFIDIGATIQTSVDNFLDNVTLHYIKDGQDTGVSTQVIGGNIEINQSVEFDEVILSDTSAYITGIQADDAVAILREIVELNQLPDNTATLASSSVGWYEADVNNNGLIQADDAVAVLRHIVELGEINTFDLIDNITGNVVTSLNVDSINVGQWSILANGDVNMSGEFNENYTVSVDIV